MRVARASVAVLISATLVAGGAAAEKLAGKRTDDVLVGTKRADRLYGKRGNDLLKGKRGNDLLSGGPGRDALFGGPGRDRLLGGPGRDLIHAVDGGRDRRVDGGGGADVCLIDVPADLPVTRRCATIQAGQAPGPGGGQGGGLHVTSAQGLTCAAPAGCVFTITGDGADALTGKVTAGGAIVSPFSSVVNGVVTGTWLASGTYRCTVGGGTGYLVVTMGTKSTPRIPVTC